MQGMARENTGCKVHCLSLSFARHCSYAPKHQPAVILIFFSFPASTIDVAAQVYCFVPLFLNTSTTSRYLHKKDKGPLPINTNASNSVGARPHDLTFARSQPSSTTSRLKLRRRSVANFIRFFGKCLDESWAREREREEESSRNACKVT